MDSLDGSNGLAAGTELGDIVFHHSFDCWEEAKGNGEGSEVLYLSRSLLHEVLPVILSHLAISQVESDVSEQNLAGIVWGDGWPSS